MRWHGLKDVTALYIIQRKSNIKADNIRPEIGQSGRVRLKAALSITSPVLYIHAVQFPQYLPCSSFCHLSNLTTRFA